ncbi:hypothetical protein NKJ06_12275 [Mesorhizobium sp. M0293]|uniref:hypothetical protein n=1 Tax=unclassified Mesorhizobium TaxID=325217 RepID=UPI00333CC927
MLKGLFDSVAGFAIFLLMLVIYFPGGTIIMALSCNSRKLDGWDWVLSVIIPGFGLLKSFFSSAC